MEGSTTTITTISEALVSALGTTANSMMGAIGDILPVALPVAGAVLVITMGWRLFRNFTKG